LPALSAATASRRAALLSWLRLVPDISPSW
jgi:hypothetical protein